MVSKKKKMRERRWKREGRSAGLKVSRSRNERKRPWKRAGGMVNVRREQAPGSCSVYLAYVKEE